MSGKGGVGKTTVSVGLALTLACEGFRVGLLDADIHGPNVPKMLGIEDVKPTCSQEGIEPVKVGNLKVISMAFLLKSKDDPIIWRGPLKSVAIRQFLSDVNWGELDYLVVDLPPGTGDEPLSIAQFIENVDGSIIVTTPQEVALLDSRKAVRFSQTLKIPVIGIIENMSGFICPICKSKVDIFSFGGGEKAAKELKVPFLGRVPIDPEIVKASDNGELKEKFFPDSSIAKIFRSIIEKIK